MKNNLFNKIIIGLAPMAGYTDSAFRQMAKDFGADLVYSEMISAQSITAQKKKIAQGKIIKSFEMVRFEQKERPILVQLFGKDPEILAEAAKIIIEKFNPEGIDLNMGCPARKVVSSFHGASLMRDSELAGKIVKAVRKATPNKILSVKTRLGWDDKNDIFEFAKVIEENGADMLAIHCRTKAQAFSGDPDWSVIKELKKTIKIPILANGGIKNFTDAIMCLKISQADGILIGQAAIGKPWIFKEIKEKKVINFDFDEILKIAKKHLEMSDNYIEMRKHLLSYFKGFKNSSELRVKICQAKNKEEFLDLIENFKKELNDDDRDHGHDQSSHVRDDDGKTLRAL